MSNYKWVTYVIVSDRKYSLRDCNFDILEFPEINYRDELLDEKFKEHNLYVYHDEDAVCRVHLCGLNYKCIYVTAPLYEQKENGNYVKISDSFTGYTLNPMLYDWAKTEIKKCYQEVKKEQEERFLKIFTENSLDSGKTSWLHITPFRYYTDDISFKERYIPEGFLKVCEKHDIYNPDLKDIFFMKKINAHGKVITITVPNEFKGLVIGKNGQNIKNISHLINAKRINVI